MDEQEMMYQSHYSSANSKMGSMYSQPRTPAHAQEEAPPKPKGALRQKVEHLEEDLRTVTDDVNYGKKELGMLRSNKEHLENVLTMKASEVRKSLANEVIKVDNTISRCMKTQVAENEQLLSQLKELQHDKEMLASALETVLRKIDSLESKVGIGGEQHEEQQQ